MIDAIRELVLNLEVAHGSAMAHLQALQGSEPASDEEDVTTVAMTLDRVEALCTLAN